MTILLIFIPFQPKEAGDFVDSTKGSLNWISPVLKADRLGLVIVVASLLVITAIILLLFTNQRDGQIVEIRTQGVSLARAISGVPYEHLVPGGQQQGVVQALLHGTGNKKLPNPVPGWATCSRRRAKTKLSNFTPRFCSKVTSEDSYVWGTSTRAPD
jgi:hypothetical protein